MKVTWTMAVAFSLVAPAARADDSNTELATALARYRVARTGELARLHQARGEARDASRSSKQRSWGSRQWQVHDQEAASNDTPVFFCVFGGLDAQEDITTQPADRQPAEVSSETDAAGTADLAKATQNPISDLISLPFQYNANFGIGPDNDVQHVLNIQPVIPVNLGEWNLINRAILPVIHMPGIRPGEGDDFGLGDLQYSAFFSPAESGSFIWGFGPVFRFPTATDTRLGSEKWSAGPSFVALTTPGRWVIGGLVQNIWSFAGDSDRPDVNELLIQPFVNYNLDDGWYLTSSPVITANWYADSSDRWLVPVGGGFGKIFRIGKQPLNLQAQAFYNVETPSFGPDWTLRVQLQLLFPKSSKGR